MKKDFKMDQGNHTPDHNKNEDDWEPIVCVCGNNQFEIFYTDDYETSIRCWYCGFMDAIHQG